MSRLQGKIAIITGASQGMGATHARRFVEHGASVVLTDIVEEQGMELASELGERAHFVHHDVSDPASWDRVVAEAERAYGVVDVLVNNAGIAGPIIPTADLSDEDYLRTVAVNQYGVFFGMRAVIPGMIRVNGGSIVNVSSVGGFAFVPGTPNVAYSASKFAVRGMSKATAVEYGDRGIRVNSVHPGAVLTPMLAANVTPEQESEINAMLPLGRMAESSEISNVVVFLASDESSYVTGTEFVVDGGMLSV